MNGFQGAGQGGIIEALRRAAARLEEVLGEGFAGLVLFGSWARGEAREDSDVDVMVVLKGVKGMEVRSRIYRVVAEEVGRPVTLIDVGLEELGRECLEVTPLLLNTLYDGVVVFDRIGILEELKERVARLVEKAGLVRYKTPDGKYGWKRVDGKPLEVVEA